METTRHGAERMAERGISLREASAAVQAAKAFGMFVSKLGKYGTPQIFYTGNGIRVVVEEASTNAGKMIAAFFV